MHISQMNSNDNNNAGHDESIDNSESAMDDRYRVEEEREHFVG